MELTTAIVRYFVIEDLTTLQLRYKTLTSKRNQRRPAAPNLIRHSFCTSNLFFFVFCFVFLCRHQVKRKRGNDDNFSSSFVTCGGPTVPWKFDPACAIHADKLNFKKNRGTCDSMVVYGAEIVAMMKEEKSSIGFFIPLQTLYVP